MDRRSLLIATTGCLSGLAGCGSPEGGDEATAAATATRTASPTATPTSTPSVTPPAQQFRPQLLGVALVSTWAETGDIEANRIETVRRGRPAVIAFRYRLRVPGGTVNLKEGIEVFDGDDLIVRRNREVDRTVESAGVHTWEDAVTLDTAGWPTGRLTASVAIGELQLHRTSDAVTTTFEVTSR